MVQTVESLINTSVDDCKISLKLITDIYLVRELFIKSTRIGHKSRALAAYRRMNQLERQGVKR